MAKFPLEPLDVTAAWLSEVLEAEVEHFRLEQIGIGVGLLGRLYRAHLEGGVGVPLSVVLKFPTLDTKVRTAICRDLEFYLREVRFYQEIGLANPLQPARPYFAAIDESTSDFVLVIEDLDTLRLADQTEGCSADDAETVIDAIARHHAHWWESARFTSLPWLKTFATPPFPSVIAGNFELAWPRFVDGFGDELSPGLHAFGERFASLVPWFCDEIARPPHTFLHGDLRLDQLFFALGSGDPPLTALDWQVTSKGRGAYDVGYFLSQSLEADTRRGCESELIFRYVERLAECGIDYSADEFERDYRLTTAWCFIYPVLAAGRIDVVNGRQIELLRVMLHRSAAAIEDHNALSVRPD
jgi:hypothetical protein